MERSPGWRMLPVVGKETMLRYKGVRGPID